MAVAIQQISPVAHLSLVLGVVRKLNVAALIDTFCPPHPAHVLSCGRGVKRVIRPMLGFKAFGAAQDTLVGIELMHMIRKKQMVVEAGEEGRTAAELFYSLAA
jgi:hypothetical protein